MIALLRITQLILWICLLLMVFKWRGIAQEIDRRLANINQTKRWALVPLSGVVAGGFSLILIDYFVGVYELNANLEFEIVPLGILYYFFPSFLFIGTASSIAPTKKKAVCLLYSLVALGLWMLVTALRNMWSPDASGPVFLGIVDILRPVIVLMTGPLVRWLIKE